MLFPHLVEKNESLNDNNYKKYIKYAVWLK